MPVQIVALFNSLTVAVDVVATIDGAAMLVDVVLALVWSDRVAVGVAVDQDFVVIFFVVLMTVRAIAMGDWLDLMGVRMLMDDFSLVRMLVAVRRSNMMRVAVRTGLVTIVIRLAGLIRSMGVRISMTMMSTGMMSMMISVVVLATKVVNLDIVFRRWRASCIVPISMIMPIFIRLVPIHVRMVSATA